MLKLTYVISENEHYVGLVSFRRSERRHAQGEEQRQIASRTHVHSERPHAQGPMPVHVMHTLQ